jgi:hypothetical protein
MNFINENFMINEYQYFSLNQKNKVNNIKQLKFSNKELRKNQFEIFILSLFV